MTKAKLRLAILVTTALACASFAAEAKHRHVRHHFSTAQSPTNAAARMPTMQPGAYGASGISIGTVTAPSVGSYSWPTVGVTNAVPTWSNTSPALRR
jgi:hypothetical protein